MKTIIFQKKDIILKAISFIFSPLPYLLILFSMPIIIPVILLFHSCGIFTDAMFLHNYLNFIFKLLLFDGIGLICSGIVLLVRVIASKISSKENLQEILIILPIVFGLLLAGILLVSAKALVQAKMGVDPTTLTFM